MNEAVSEELEILHYILRTMLPLLHHLAIHDVVHKTHSDQSAKTVQQDAEQKAFDCQRI